MVVGRLVLALALVFAQTAPQPAARRATVAQQFRVATGYPKGRKGYVVDHVIPLCAGGADAVANMQWQSVERSYLKDTYERALCAAMKKQGVILVKR